jgi:hypothetical protein
MACCHLMARIRSHTARVPANRIAAAAVTPAHVKSAAVTASTPARVVGVGSSVSAPLLSTQIATWSPGLVADCALTAPVCSVPAADQRTAMVALLVREMLWAGSVVGDRRGDEVTSVVLLGVDVAA